MTCVVQEHVYPKATVTWFRDERNGFHNFTTGSTFIIKSAELSDTGLYFCQAHNYPNKRVDTKFFHLKVYGMIINIVWKSDSAVLLIYWPVAEPISCKITPESILVMPRKEIKIEVTLQGNPFPSNSNIFAMQPWLIARQHNRSYIMKRNYTKRVRIIGSQREVILVAYQTVTEFKQSISRNVSCIVEVKHSTSSMLV